MKFCALFALATAAAVSAGIVTPRELAPRQATTAAYCTIVNSRCSVATQSASVSSYCSSYLGVPKVTSTRTASAAAVTQRVVAVQRLVLLTTTYLTAATTSTVRQTSTINTTKWITASTTRITSIISTSTSSSIKTITTGTSTIQASALTSTITSCAPTTIAGGQFTIMRVPGSTIGWKRDEEHELFERQAIAKPTCYSRYTTASIISSACSCATISKSTVYATSTVTPTTTITSISTSTTTSIVTATRTNTVFTTSVGTITNTILSTTIMTFVSTVSSRVTASTIITSNVIATITAPASTTIFTFAALPTFYIQNDNLNYAYLSAPYGSKQKRASSGTLAFDSIPQSSAQLFTLPGLTGGLVDNTGRVAAETIDTPDAAYDNIDVQLVDASDLTTGAFAPVSCTIVRQLPDGTCPLSCQFGASSDVNQGDPFGNWMLGQPGVAAQETYKIFAVSPPTTGTGAGSSVRHPSRR